MPNRPASLSKLIDTLARLFVDVDSSRLVVERAEMDPTVIAFDARALFNWTAIVNEAIRQEKLPQLVAVADEMYPNVPELKNSLADYQAWAAKNAEHPAVIEPPKIWERFRFGIIGTAFSVFAIFAVIGIVARESQHFFYGLPSSRNHHLLRDPAEWFLEGVRLVARTLLLMIDYLTLNPIGMLAVLILASLAVYAVVRWRQALQRVYKPAIIVPALILLALFKSAVYDMPTRQFQEVLTRASLDTSAFEIPPLFQQRAATMWRSVVCSRIAGANAAQCGNQPAGVYEQQLYGRFLLDILFTLGLTSFGVRVITKLLLPSRELAWNLPVLWQHTAAGGAALALLIAILGVPWAYSRTTRATRAQKLCAEGGDCYYLLCEDRAQRECYAYRPEIQDITELTPEERKKAKYSGADDVLTQSLLEQLGTLNPTPQDKSNRLGGGM